MFQVITMWNMTRPDLEMRQSVEDIKLRGYNSSPEAKVFLTGEFATRIAGNEIRALSVSDIANRQCPTRRDVYYKKGVNRPRRAGISTWGKIAGRITERYVFDLFLERMNKGNGSSYQGIKRITSKYSKLFQGNNQTAFDDLAKMKTKDYESPDWLTRLLNSNGRAELGLKILHSVVFDRGKDADFKNLKLNINNSLRFNPRPREVGISSGVEPDFLIEEYKVVGDIKSGTKFEDYFPLTCAGYALAYENEKGKGHDIDWGIIYFIPTRYPTDYVKPLTCAQVYIFPVDDNLRRWFIDVRDQDYSTISKDTPPNHPEVDKRHHCPYCTFKETCEPKA